MDQDPKPVMEMREVTKVYQTKANLFSGKGGKVVALDAVSLSFMPGEVFGLVGESGSGKTTCGRLLVALERPNAGRILLEGEELTGKGPLPKDFRRRVQMVFQDPYQSLNPQLSILDSVSEPLICNRVGTAMDRTERVAEALARAGLKPPEEFIYRFPHQLSGGQRQRVAIARAIITQPTCLVADEPTSMLDASYSAQIFDILLGVRNKLGATVVFITHSLAAARYLCDRIAVIYRGHLMETGPAQEVINRPRHPYTKALLDATPRFGRNLAPPTYDTLLKAPRPSAEATGCAFYTRCKPAHRIKCGTETPGWHQVGPEHASACHFAKEMKAAG